MRELPQLKTLLQNLSDILQKFQGLDGGEPAQIDAIGLSPLKVHQKLVTVLILQKVVAHLPQLDHVHRADFRLGEVLEALVVVQIPLEGALFPNYHPLEVVDVVELEIFYNQMADLLGLPDDLQDLVVELEVL